MVNRRRFFAGVSIAVAAIFMPRERKDDIHTRKVLEGETIRVRLGETFQAVQVVRCTIYTSRGEKRTVDEIFPRAELICDGAIIGWRPWPVRWSDV